MSRFIYVFDRKAKDDLLKRGFALLREDTRNQIWIFENKEPEAFDFELGYQCVLSNVLPL